MEKKNGKGPEKTPKKVDAKRFVNNFLHWQDNNVYFKCESPEGLE